MNEIREHTIDVLRKNIPDNMKSMEILDDHTLRTDLLIDSIAFLSVLVELEYIFNITFNIAVMDAAPFQTVGKLIEYISNKVGQQRGNFS